MKIAFFFCSLLFVLELGCSGSTSTANRPINTEEQRAVLSGPKTDWVESTLRRLTLEEKVAQLVVVWTPGSYASHESPRWQDLERLIVGRKLGGFVFSIGDVYEYAVQANKLQRLSDVPLLFAADLEYGPAMRVRGATRFPHAMAIGATRTVRYAYEVGKATAEEARALGIVQNYAPVADVNNNAKNPVINIRSYGDDVKLVSDMVSAFVKGTQDAGVIATVKHYPGHGDTDVDTHLGLPTINYNKERFEKIELAPFREAFKAGAMSVMVGHISVPAFDSVTGIPATVSPRITTNLLRDQEGFQGLVVTDALGMRGISSKYAPAEAALLALKAGNDLLLMPVDADVAIDAIIAAVKRGEISEERITASVRKLLKYKKWAGLDTNRYVDIEKVYDAVGSRSHQLLAKEIERKAVTVLGNRNNILPFSKSGTKTILDLAIGDTEDPSIGKGFNAELMERYSNVDFAKIDPRSNAMEYDAALAKVATADIVLIQLQYFVRSGEMTGFLSKEVKELINKVLARGKPCVAISFGNPYLVMDFPKVDAYVCTYGGGDVSEEAAAQIIFGEESAAGKLPISIPGVFHFGEGIEYPKQALREGRPEEAGFNSKMLSKIDDVVVQAISDSAFPGAVVLVAKDGIVVHNEAYGAYTYEPSSKLVDNTTMYDLASVTKVTATTSAVMRLYDEGKIRLEDPIVKYIPAFGQKGKEKITVYNLMVHNSGLPAWRTFYTFCSDPQCVLDSIFSTELVYKTGDSTVYSDLGLITMGKVIEKVSGVTLDKYVDSVFFKPLGMKNTMYNPPAKLISHIAPTEVDNYWKKTGTAVRGRVHDENATTLGGVSGHAGLFSTASDLAILLQMELNGGTYGGQRYLKEGTIRMFTKRQSEKSTRGIGWDTRSFKGYSFVGSQFSDKSFIHTGFTGTSVAVDPTRNLIVVFLTNRVYPTRNDSKLFDVRPKVHNAVVNALTK
jgi:beta-glucosidase-like glycosyl hydrolase/CubicO group peptidase (beta-lactamase class C family)